MNDHRYVVLGLAHARSSWSGELSRWSTAAVVPVDFVRCVSPDELRARLAAGRPFSAVIVDSALPRLDRDLVDCARSVGASVVVVDDGRTNRNWAALGAAAVLTDGFEPADLLAALHASARPIDRVDLSALQLVTDRDPVPGRWRGHLIAVTGSPGTGRSTIAMALAQGRARDARDRGLVLLADLALRADLAMLHDGRDIVPGIQELVEAHRTGRPDGAGLRRLVHDVDERGYHLLLGLRRPRDWTALRPRALEAALDTLVSSYRLVVADVDADVDGEATTGSVDVEDRNLLARSTVARADLVAVVGDASCKGLHSLVRVLDDLREFGVAPDRLLPVVNRAPRSPRARAEIVRTIETLAHRPRPGGHQPPGHDPNSGAPPPGVVFVSERRRLDDVIVDAAPLPESMSRALARSVQPWLDRSAVPAATDQDPDEPVPILAGQLGHFGAGPDS